MATITLTPFFNDLPDWPGFLFGPSSETLTTAHSRTSFAYTFADGAALAGYTVTVTGTGFTYDGGIPTGGTMTRIMVTDGTSNTVFAAEGFGSNTVASNFSLFYQNVFGWADGYGGVQGPQPFNSWSMVLSGKDVINGTEGDDRQQFPGMNSGNDVYNMLGGNDVVWGDMGSDTINGGDGGDWLTFDSTYYFSGVTMTRGIKVDVAAGTVIDAWGFTDHVTSIEYFVGSPLRDKLIGSTGTDNFAGGRGVDTFIGGAGEDRILYDDDASHGATHGIVVNLEVSNTLGHIHGTVRDGFGNKDLTTDIEDAIGTKYDDTFVGSSEDNVFVGRQGKDSFDGGGGGDWIWFFWGDTDVGVSVDLSLTQGQIKDDGFGNVENTISIENIVGSSHPDHIKGSTGTNWIEGNDGKDTLTGGGGADTFVWYNLPDFGDNDVITDFHARAGADQDVLRFNMSGFGYDTTLHLVNGTAATEAAGTFIFNAANHVLYFDDDGTGAHAKFAVATLNGVTALHAGNFDLF